MRAARRGVLAGIVWALVARGGGLAAQQKPAAGQPAQLQVSLAEAVRRALDVQPSIVQARGDVRTAGADQRSAAGAFLPTITASGSANLASPSRYNAATGQIVTVPSNTSYSGSLGLSLDLFDGFQRLANKRAAAATEDAADAGLINQRYQVTATTPPPFFTPPAAQ